MTKTEYLYGNLPQEVIEKQREIAITKVSYAMELQRQLMEADYMERDETRLRAVYEAIKWNDKIINEGKD